MEVCIGVLLLATAVLLVAVSALVLVEAGVL